jgi:predicted phosphodiesterase
LRLAHLSDLHLRSRDDLDRFEAQVRMLVRARIDHLAVTGDLLERWEPRLFDAALDILRHADLFHRNRLTIIHGNHDLVSAGAPHTARDRRRLLIRFWDPEPLLRWRRRRFYQKVAPLFAGSAEGLPAIKEDVCGIDLLAIDTVPTRFRPVAVRRHTSKDRRDRSLATGSRIELRHALGTVPDGHAAWLSSLPHPQPRPRVLLMHHYPLPTPDLTWRRIVIPMEIPKGRRDLLWRAIHDAGVSLVLCGHVHRSRAERIDGVTVGLEGTSGGAWADYGASVWTIDGSGLVSKHEKHTAGYGSRDTRRAV